MARFLSIDVDSHGLLVASGSVGRGTAALEQCTAFTEFAAPLTAENAELAGARLKQLLKDAGIAPAPAMVVLGRDRIIVKEVRHPPVPPADEPGVVRFQALKDAADGADDSMFDYVPVPAPPNSIERRAAVAFVKKDVVAAVRRMCEVAGLRPLALVPRPFAAAAALQQAAAAGAAPPPDTAEGPVAVAVLHEAGGEFTVCRNGTVLFSRPIPATAVAAEDSLLLEFRRNLAVAASQAGGEVQAIYLAEAEARGGWSGRLRADLGMPVYAFDPLAASPAASQVPQELHGRFLGAAGLLALKASPAGLPINFLQPRQPRRGPAQANPKRTRALVGALAGVLVFGGLFAYGFLKLGASESELASLQQRLKQVEEEIKLEEVNAKKLAAVQEFTRRDVNWLDEFYDHVARFPNIRRSAIRMTNFEGTAVALPTDRDRAAKAAKPPARNAPPEPAANITMTLTAEDSKLPAEFTDALNRLTRFYVGASMNTPGMSGSGTGVKSSMQQFIIRTGVVARSPAEYVLTVIATLPKAEPEPPKPEKPNAEEAGGDES